MSLLPSRYNFTIWRTATFRTSMTVYTGATALTPPRDLTGYSAQLLIKDKPSGSVLLTLDAGLNGGITLGGTDGTLELLISSTDTATLSWKSGVYDLEITAPGGDTDALLFGHFKVKGI